MIITYCLVPFTTVTQEARNQHGLIYPVSLVDLTNVVQMMLPNHMYMVFPRFVSPHHFSSGSDRARVLIGKASRLLADKFKANAFELSKQFLFAHGDTCISSRASYLYDFIPLYAPLWFCDLERDMRFLTRWAFTSSL